MSNTCYTSGTQRTYQKYEYDNSRSFFDLYGSHSADTAHAGCQVA
jgi:hypothetical protein